jgi:hypothetical protein
MLVFEGTTAVVASRAYELAQTGEFEDFAAIERQLLAEGFGEHVVGLKRPALQSALGDICAARRQAASHRRKAA